MMMSNHFLSTPWHTTPLFGMEKYIPQILSLCLPSSLLLSGPKGVGKSTFAYHIARYFLQNQKNDFFISSPSPLFERVAQRAHGNLKVIEPDILATGKRSRDISVESIRRVLYFLQTTAFEEGPRIVIIDSTDDLSLKAANALLKILEEPPKNSMIILICHNIARLLPTLRSRCYYLKINPLTDQTMEKFIDHFFPHSPPLDKSFFIDFCEGCPGPLKNLIEMGGFTFYEKVLNLIVQSAQGNLESLDHFIDTFATKISSISTDQNLALEIFNFTFLKIIKTLAEENIEKFLTDEYQKQYLILKQNYNYEFWLKFWSSSFEMLTSIQSHTLDFRYVFMSIFSKLILKKN